MHDRVFDRFIKQCHRAQLAPAVVLGSSFNALSYLRSLGRRQIPILCGDTHPGIASKSRFGTFAVLTTNPDDAVPGEQAADRLLTRFKEQRISPIVFGASDQWQIYLAKRAASANFNFRTLMPTEQTMARIVDKQDQYEFASNLGIDVPPFANASEVMEGRVAWDVFPAIIKPRWAHAGRAAIGAKAVRVNSAMELRSILARLDEAVDVGAYLIQTVVGGGDDCLYAYLACYDDKSREVSWLIKRKLRQYPPSFGDGSYDTTCVDDEVVIAARTLLTALEYQGLVGIEFKRNAATGALSMIEINPRTVSNNQLAITAGVDFPWQAYQLTMGKALDGKLEVDASGDAPYRVGVLHIHEERECRLFLRRWRSGETGLIEWLRCVYGAQSYAIWDRGDPWPLIWTAWDGITQRLRRRKGANAIQQRKAEVSRVQEPRSSSSMHVRTEIGQA